MFALYTTTHVQSRTQLTQSPVTIETLFNGNLTFSVGARIADDNSLTVVNGLVNGNKKDANPIYFRKTVGKGHPYEESQSGTKWGLPSHTKTFGRLYEGNLISTPYLVPDFGRTSDRALEKVFDQVRGNPNVIVDLAESAATIRMLRGTLNFRRFASDFFREFAAPPRRGRGRGPTAGQRRLDYITGKWLEYRYGWTPLVNSVYDAMDTVMSNARDMVCTVKGRSGSYQATVNRSGVGTYQSPESITAAEMWYRTEYGINFHLPPGLQIYDWTSLNPLAIAWELTPLSFVADWFVNVSQQLSLMENWWLYRSTFRGGYKTTSFKEVVVNRTSGRTELPLLYWSNGQPQDNEFRIRVIRKGFDRIVTQKERVVLTSLPFPSGSLRLNVKLGAKRQLDAAALVHQLFAKRGR